MFTIIGGIGAVAFAIASLPLIFKAIHEKSSRSISTGYIILGLIGNICSATYVIWTNILSNMFQIPLYFNYGVATVCILILIFLKIHFSDKHHS